MRAFQHNSQLNKSDYLNIYKAIINSDVDYIQQKIIFKNLVDIHCDFSDISEAPSVLKYSPPIISVAAYYENLQIFDLLIMNNAPINEVDKILLKSFINNVKIIKFMEF